MSFWGLPIDIQSAPTNPFDSDASTIETIHQMIAVAGISSRSPIIHSKVDQLIHSLPIHPSKRDLVRAIYWWVKNHVAFREDEDTLHNQMGYADPNQELLISPEVLISMPQPMGDCDDFSMLIASLCLASGIHVWFKTVCVDEFAPERWSHVYCVVEVEGKFIPLDASHGKYPGWETNRKVYRSATWYVG